VPLDDLSTPELTRSLVDASVETGVKSARSFHRSVRSSTSSSATRAS